MTGELIPSMDSSTTTAGSSSMNSKKKNRRSRSFRSLALSNTTTSSSDLGDLEPKNIQMTFKSKKKSNNELSTSQSADRNQFHSTLRSFSQSSVPSLHQNSKSIPLSEKYLIPSYVTSSKKTSSKTPLPFSSAEHSKKQMPSNHSQAARSQSASSPIFQPPPSRNSCFKTSYDKKPRSSSDIKQVSSSEYSPPKKNVTYSSMASTSSKSKRTSTPVPYDLSKPVPSKTSFEPSKTFFSNFNENSTHFSEHHPPHIQKNIPPPMHPLQKKYQEFRPTRVPPSFTSFSSSTNTFSFTSTPASFNNLSSSTSFNVQAANFIPFKPPPNHSNLSITSPRSNVHGHSKAPKSEPQWIPPSTSTTFVPNHVQTIVSMDYRSIEHMNFQQFQKMLPPRPGTNREVLHNIDDVTSQFSSQLSLKEKTYPTRSESHRSLYVPKNLKSTIATRTSSSASSSETSSFSSKSSPLIYTNYLSKREMEEGLVSGKFMYGILRARKASPVHAYVKPIVPVLPLIYTQQAAETYYETNQRLEMATSCNLDPLKNGKKMDEESNVDTVTQIQTELDDVLSQTQESNQEVLIFGHFNRNRAMEGDFVVIELLDQVSAMNEMENYFEHRRSEAKKLQPLCPASEVGQEINAEPTTLLSEAPNIQLLATVDEELDMVPETNVILPDDEKEEVEVEELIGEVEPTLATLPTKPKLLSPKEQIFGKVVGIWQAQCYKHIPGIVLPPLDSSNTSLNWYTFKPLNGKLPLCVVRIDTLPYCFAEIENPFSYLYLASFLPWKVYHRRATVEIVSCVGPLGEPNAEIEGILCNHNIERPRFHESMINEFPSGWTIPSTEREKRIDRTSLCVFSIDPESAKDLDDALHIQVLEDQVFEVGVHIADVSYFVKPFSSLDKHASRFCNSIYLINEVIPMLPKRLCEELCSLNPGAERLCFSVLWKITKDGTILSTDFERSIIRSRIKLTYEQVQTWLNGDELTLEDAPEDLDQVRTGVFQLYELSKILRQQRIDAGLLTLGSKRLQFELDPKTNLPMTCQRRTVLASHRLNEEFMILANLSVGEKLYATFPDFSFLRKHASPSLKSLEHCINHFALIGLTLNGFTSKDLQTCIYGISDPLLQRLVLFGMSRYMQKAKYVCTYQMDSTLARHFALGLNFYTHFTSPIRRYSDILVHRLLECAINQQDPSTLYTPFQLQSWAHQCNKQKDCARAIEEEQQAVFVGFYVNELIKLNPNGHVLYVAHVWKFFEKYIELVILELSLEIKVFFSELPLTSWSLDQENGVVHLVWKPVEENNENSILGLPPFNKKTLRLLDQVRVNLNVKWKTSPPIIKVDLVE